MYLFHRRTSKAGSPVLYASLGSNPVFGFRGHVGCRFGCRDVGYSGPNATDCLDDMKDRSCSALNRRRHERFQPIQGNFVGVKLGIRDSALRIRECYRAEQAATVMYPPNRQRRSPPHVSHSCGSCPLQDAMLAAGLSEKYEVKTAVTDAADCKAGMAWMPV